LFEPRRFSFQICDAKFLQPTENELWQLLKSNRPAENRRRGGNLWFAGRFFLYGHKLKSVLVRQGRGNVAEETKYATKIFRNIRAVKPTASVARTVAKGIMKFRRHVGQFTAGRAPTSRRLDQPRRPGSAGVSPAGRWPKTGTRRRDASAPRKCAPVQGPDARPKLEVEAPQACALGVKGSVFDEKNRNKNKMNVPIMCNRLFRASLRMATRNGNNFNRGRN